MSPVIIYNITLFQSLQNGLQYLSHSTLLSPIYIITYYISSIVFYYERQFARIDYTDLQKHLFCLIQFYVRHQLKQTYQFFVGGLISYLLFLCLFVWRRAHILFTLFVFVCVQWCQIYIMLCFCFVCLRLVFPMLPVSLECPHFLSPLRYSVRFILSLLDIYYQVSMVQ